MIFRAVAELDIKREALLALADLDDILQIRLSTQKSGGASSVEFLWATVLCLKHSPGATAKLTISGERAHMLTDAATLKTAMASTAPEQEVTGRLLFAQSPFRVRFLSVASEPLRTFLFG